MEEELTRPHQGKVGRPHRISFWGRNYEGTFFTKVYLRIDEVDLSTLRKYKDWVDKAIDYKLTLRRQKEKT